MSKETISSFEQPSREQTENDITNNIMFSVLSGGFSTNRDYGNQKKNYYAFDIRGDEKIMSLINNNKSFITTTVNNGKEYKIAGLALNRNHAEVGQLAKEQCWVIGRNGYVFATIEDTKNLPNNINEILIEEATKSAKALFCQIRDWNDAITAIQ